MKTPIDYIETELWKQSKNGTQTLPVGTIMRLMEEYALEAVTEVQKELSTDPNQNLALMDRIKNEILRTPYR